MTRLDAQNSYQDIETLFQSTITLRRRQGPHQVGAGDQELLPKDSDYVTPLNAKGAGPFV